MPQQIANIQKAHIFGFHHICILKSNKIDWFLQEAFNHHHLVHSSSGENNSSERVCHRSNLLSMFFSVSNQCLNLSPLALIPNWTPPEGSKISRHKRSCWFIIRREIAGSTDALTQWRLVNIALQTNGSSIKLLWNVNFSITSNTSKKQFGLLLKFKKSYQCSHFCRCLCPRLLSPKFSWQVRCVSRHNRSPVQIVNDLMCEIFSKKQEANLMTFLKIIVKLNIIISYLFSTARKIIN